MVILKDIGHGGGCPMAKSATRMKTIVLESSSEQHYPRNVNRGPDALRTHVRTADAGDTTSQRGSVQQAHVLVRDPRSELFSTVEQQIIPRLLVAHDVLRGPSTTVARPAVVLPTAADASELASLAVLADVQRALALPLTMLGAGLTLETVLMKLIAVAARRLGSDWEEDLRSFTDVTVGLGTLHELVHLLVPPPVLRPSYGALHQPAPRGRVLLMGGAGEQHTLGLNIFDELLRQDRWSVLLELAMSPRDVLSCVRTQPIEAVGLCLSSPERLRAAAELIAGIKDQFPPVFLPPLCDVL